MLQKLPKFAGLLVLAGLTMLIFSGNGLAKEGTAMANTRAESINRNLPPLDVAAAAVKTETATFALG
jgi:hypothetical protein